MNTLSEGGAAATAASRRASMGAASLTAAAASHSVSAVAGQAVTPATAAAVAGAPNVVRARRGAAFGTSEFQPLASSQAKGSKAASEAAAAALAAKGAPPVKESTMLCVWRFIVALKRRVASLVRSLQHKGSHVRRLLLARFPILSRVPPALLQQLCIRAQKKIFQRKYTLIRQGEVSEYVYVVAMGCLAIHQQSEHVLSAARGAEGAPKFDSLHVADLRPGDEAGMYGVLRPHTIVDIDGGMGHSRGKSKRKHRKQQSSSTGGMGSDSDSDDSGSKKHRRDGSIHGSGSFDPRGGYPQPYSVIASQPSIVFALSARLWREVLLSAPNLYVAVREELTNKYLLRLARFEKWEIGRMRRQKVLQLQQTIMEGLQHVHATAHVRGGSGGSQAQLDERTIRQAFEQAEAIVARDSIAALFGSSAAMAAAAAAATSPSKGSSSTSQHRSKKKQKRHMTVNSRNTAGRAGDSSSSSGSSVSNSDDDSTGAGAGAAGRFRYGATGRALGLAEGVLLSQWNEHQSGEFDKRCGALSPTAPHHPAPSFAYVSVSSQVSQNRAIATPAMPFVDTRRLVGSRREYDPHFGVGTPARHQITAAGGQLSASAKALLGTEQAHRIQSRQLAQLQQHTLPPLSIVETSSALLASGMVLSPSSKGGAESSLEHSLSLMQPDAPDRNGYGSGGVGSYVSPEEAAYQRRLAKLQAKVERKVHARRTREEEKFLEDIMSVSQNLQELMRKRGNAAAQQALLASSPEATPPASASTRKKQQAHAKKVAALRDNAAATAAAATASSPAASPVQSPLVSPVHSPTLQPSQGSLAALRSPASSTGVLSPSRTAASNSSSAVRPVGGLSSAFATVQKPQQQPHQSQASEAPRTTVFVSTMPAELMFEREGMGARGPGSNGHAKRDSMSFSFDWTAAATANARAPSEASGGSGAAAVSVAENPLYSSLPTLPSSQLHSLFASLSKDKEAASAPVAYLLETMQAQKGLYEAVPRLDGTIENLNNNANSTAKAKSPNKNASSNTSTSASAEHAAESLSPKKMVSKRDVLVNITPAGRMRTLSPTRAGGAAGSRSTVASSSSAPAAPPPPPLSPVLSYHSLAFHNFTDEAWRGVTRVSTPPLVPPSTEDPRVAAIRAGIERAQFRVKARGRETRIPFKEFSRENKKQHTAAGTTAAVLPGLPDASGVLPSLNEPASSLPIGLTLLSPLGTADGVTASAVVDAARSSAASAAATNQPPGASVLGIFSASKARERGRRSYTEALVGRVGVPAEKQRLERKKRSEQMRKRLMSSSSTTDTAAASLLPERDASIKSAEPVAPVVALAGLSSSDDDDDDDDDDEAEADDIIPGEEEKSRRPTRRKQQASGDPVLASHPRMRHDTFLSPHHKRVLSSMSTISGLTDLAVAAALVPSVEEQEFQQWRQRREHQQRVELLSRDKLAPAPGVDADTLRKQLQEEAAWRRAQPFDAGALPSKSLLRAVQLMEAATATTHHDEAKQEDQLPASGAGNTVSPSHHGHIRHTTLGQSMSLPSFVNPTSDARLQVTVHPSSLSCMLAQSKRTKAELAAALPSVALAFDSSDNGSMRGRADRADQLVIDALTQPAHRLHFAKDANQAASPGETGGVLAQTSDVGVVDVAGQLASMLVPFRRDADAMAGRGMHIPSYEEPDEGMDVIAAFQRKRVERSRVAIQQLHANTAQVHAAEVRGAAAAAEEALGLGRKDPRAIYRPNGAAHAMALTLEGRLPPAPAGKKVYQAAGPAHALAPKQPTLRRSRCDAHARSMPALPRPAAAVADASAASSAKQRAPAGERILPAV